MKRLLKSFRYAFNGIASAFSEQPNLRIHGVIVALVVGAGFYFGLNESEWLAVVLAIGLVVTAELFNTSLEHMVNFVSPQRQPLAGNIKDIAAGAVLLAAITSGIVGCIVFSRYLFP